MIMKTLLLSILVILTWGQTLFADDLEKERTQLTSIKTNIEQNQIFFHGIPSYVPITFTNSQKKSIQIYEWNVLQVYSPVSVELIGTNNQKHISNVITHGFILGEVDTTTGPRYIFREKWIIEPNESRRCLVNLGPAIENMKIPAGKYQMRVCVWENLTTVVGRSDIVTVQIADLKAEDKQWLSENLEVSSGGIKKIKRTITPSVIKSIPSKDLREQLAFNIILNILASRKELSETKINGYENLVAPYLSDDIELFKYEILLAKKDKDNAEQVKKSLTAKGHSMDYWLKQAEDGKGYIKFLKSMGDESIEKNARLIDANSPD
jgi:hypothetical protein